MARAEAALADFDQRAASMLAASGQDAVDKARQSLKEDLLRLPIWLEYTGNLFPVICMVFLLRSFVVEPFKIPSASMVPTLQAGDLILVNKYNYGIRLPVINRKIIEIGQPERGDVMVFKYPVDPSVDYIKRVIGLPGDLVEYKDKVLSINGTPVSTTSLPDYFDTERVLYSKHYSHQIDGKQFRTVVDEDKPAYIFGSMQFPLRENCQYSSAGVSCRVPDGHYFMMGDNRDNSSDSRIWGFVPDRYIVGRAFLVWMNFSQLSRIGFFK
jgi:signal peptidase I